MIELKKNCIMAAFIFSVAHNLRVECCISGSSEDEILGDPSSPTIVNTRTTMNERSFDNLPEQSLQKATMVQFCLFTRQNPNNAIVINSVKRLNFEKRIKILIHGWRGNSNIGYIRVIKDAYLERYDCNVISVNYTEYAKGSYFNAFSFVQTVGEAIAEFICKITSKVSSQSLHVIGHSVGAQVSGIAGHQTKVKCQKTIGRITGLDPSGPIFKDVAESLRLDRKDAAFVDVMHTNHKMYGFNRDCGTVDFYVNCGYFQPGCLFNESTFCHHQRSCYLFAESITSNSFHADLCTGCGQPVCFPRPQNVVSPTNVYMGESCRTATKESKYLVYTNGEPPYAKDPEGPS